MTQHALHSAASAEHYTPPAYVEAARQALGAIDLDPASCKLADTIVQAGLFYTAEDEGQHEPWFGRVYVNPPGDGNKGVLKREFWRRSCEHALYGADDAAVIWAGYSLGPLQRLHNCEPFEDGTPCPGPRDWPIVYVSHKGPNTTGGGRIKWISGDTMQPGKQPGHNNYFCLLGGTKEQRQRFRLIFGAFGDYHSPRSQPRRRRDLRTEILDVLGFGHPMTKKGIAETIGARRADVIRMVDHLTKTGALIQDGRRWKCSQESGT
jgi:hypothetical protein